MYSVLCQSIVELCLCELCLNKFLLIETTYLNYYTNQIYYQGLEKISELVLHKRQLHKLFVFCQFDTWLILTRYTFITKMMINLCKHHTNVCVIEFYDGIKLNFKKR